MQSRSWAQHTALTPEPESMTEPRRFNEFPASTQPIAPPNYAAPWWFSESEAQDATREESANEDRTPSTCDIYGCHVTAALTLVVVTLLGTVTLLRVTQGAELTKYPDEDPPAPMTRAFGRGRLIERHEPVGRSSGESSFDSDNTPVDAGIRSLIRVALNASSNTSQGKTATTAGQRTTTAPSMPTAEVNERPTKSKFSKGPGTPGKRKIWVVISTYGPIVGNVIEVSGRKVAVFRGIPYAQEMNKNNRFEPSRRRVMPWKRTRKAFRDGPSCPQPRHPSDHPAFSTTSQSENCLYVNVWVPLCEDGARECPRRATVVYFHGGNLLRGSNSMPAYDGAVLSGLGKVIVAVPNYRLGVFGFLNRKVKGTQPNLGLGDQYLALDWIRNNTVAFGGRPGDVVVYGHDSGAYSAGLPLFSPALKRLGVTKAILSGGSPILAPAFANCDTQWEGFLKNLRCSRRFFDDALACLRKASREKLVTAQSLYPASVGIVHPHTLLPRSPSQFLRLAQNFSGVQVLLTNTLPEGLGEVYGTVDVNIGRVSGAYTQLPERPLEGIGVMNLKPKLLTLFKHQDRTRQPPGAPPASSVGFQDDVAFNCPSVLFAQRACEFGADVLHVIIGQQPRFWKSAFRFEANSSYMGDVYFAFGLSYSQLPHFGGELGVHEVEGMRRDALYARGIIDLIADFSTHGVSGKFVADHHLRPYCDGAQSTLLFEGLRSVSHWRTEQCKEYSKYIGYL